MSFAVFPQAGKVPKQPGSTMLQTFEGIVNTILGGAREEVGCGFLNPACRGQLVVQRLCFVDKNLFRHRTVEGCVK